MTASTPTYFATAAAFGAWLKKNHAKAPELLVGFYKTGSGRPSMTWPESVDEALAFGWIDGVRKSVDHEAYTIRFTPRRPGSIWSKINVDKVTALQKAGRMHPAGEKAYAARKEAKTGIYSFERQEAAELTPAELKAFRAQRKAHAFFTGEAPSYQRTALHWIVSAKKPETRAKRLAQLIADSEAGERLAHLRWSKKTATKTK